MSVALRGAVNAVVEKILREPDFDEPAYADDLGSWLVDRAYGRVVSDFRRNLGLPHVPARTQRQLRTGAKWPILHRHSPVVAPRPPD